VIRGAVAAGFPTVHPLPGVDVFAGQKDGGARLEEVFLGGKEIVGGGKDGAPQAFGGEVDQICKVGGHFRECECVIDRAWHYPGIILMPGSDGVVVIYSCS
jgi:hypothetical protein